MFVHAALVVAFDMGSPVTGSAGSEESSAGRGHACDQRRGRSRWGLQRTAGVTKGDGRDPNECMATENHREGKCSSSVSPHPFRRSAITHYLYSDVPETAVSDRANVSTEITSTTTSGHRRRRWNSVGSIWTRSNGGLDSHVETFAGHR